jgi:hypothetical protein
MREKFILMYKERKGIHEKYTKWMKMMSVGLCFKY